MQIKSIIKAILLVIVLISPGSAVAHPLGTESFGQRSLLKLYPDHIEYKYVMEIPTAVLLKKIGEYKEKRGMAKFDKQASDEFNREMLDQLRKGLELYIDGMRHGWQPVPSFTDTTGKGDVNFFEYRLMLTARLPDPRAGSEHSLEIANKNYKDFKAVYLNGLVAEKGVEIKESNVPEKMDWRDDYSYRRVKVAFKLNPAWGYVTRLGSAATPEKLPGGERGRITALLQLEKPTLSLVLIALGTAFLLGAAHAFSPGHGKALVSAYLVGAKGRYIHAVLLGLIVTLTHTGTVFILGLIFLIFSGRWMPEQLTPYIGVASGGIIVIIGVYMFYRRWMDLKRGGHEHIHGEPSLGLKSLLAMGISGGMVPCPSALALMLVAISINRAAWGIALIGAFSIGLAAVLVGLGILAVGAVDIFKRIRMKGKAWAFIPILSSVVVMIVGIALVIAGLRAL